MRDEWNPLYHEPVSNNGRDQRANAMTDTKFSTISNSITEHAAWRALYRAARCGDCKTIQYCLSQGALPDELYNGTYAVYEATTSPTEEAFTYLLEQSAPDKLRMCQYDGWHQWYRDYDVGCRDANRLRLITRVALAPWRDRDKKLALIAQLIEKDLGYLHPLIIAVIADDVTPLSQNWVNMASCPLGSQKGITLLQYAAANNSGNVVRWLLTKGVSASEKINSLGTTPILFAAANGHLQMCQLLFDHGAQMTEKNYEGDCALLLASRHGHLPVVQWLLENGALVSERDCKGSTTTSKSALYHAAEQGREAVFQYLLESKADYRENYYDVSAWGRRKWNALHFSAKGGSRAIMRCLIDRGMLRQASDAAFALSIAVHYVHLEVVKLLLTQGVTFDEQSELRLLSVYAAQEGRLDVLQLLSTILRTDDGPIGRSACRHQGETALLAAAKNGQLPVVRWSLEHGSTLDEKISNNQNHYKNETHHATALILAARAGHAHIVEYLIESKANADEISWGGRTVIFFALEQGHFTLAQQLHTRHAARLDVRSKNGITVLHMAAKSGHLESVQWLISKGLSALAKTDFRTENTVVDYAGKQGHLHIIYWLFSNDPLLIASLGERALYWAAKQGDAARVQWLIHQGAEVVAFDQKNDAYSVRTDSPFLAAIESGDLPTVQLLFHINVSVDDRKKAIPRAAQYGHIAVAEWLLSQGIRLTDRMPYETALSRAAEQGHVSMMQCLSAKGANIHEKFRKRQHTALFSAVQAGRLSAVTWLIAHHARMSDCIHLTIGSLTPLLVAIHAKRFDMVQLLLAHSAPASPDQGTHTPVFFALEFLNDKYGEDSELGWEIVKLLLANGYSVNEAYQEKWNAHLEYPSLGKGGRTPFHYTIFKSDFTLTKWLAELGASLQLRDDDGNSALLIAASQYVCDRTIPLCEWLLENGADIKDTNHEQKTVWHLLDRFKSDGTSSITSMSSKPYMVSCRDAIAKALIWFLKKYPVFISDHGYRALECFARTRPAYVCNATPAKTSQETLTTIEWLLEQKVNRSESSEHQLTIALLNGAYRVDYKLLALFRDKGISFLRQTVKGDNVLSAFLLFLSKIGRVEESKHKQIVLELTSFLAFLLQNGAGMFIFAVELPNAGGLFELIDMLQRLLSNQQRPRTPWRKDNTLKKNVMINVYKMLLDHVHKFGMTIPYEFIKKLQHKGHQYDSKSDEDDLYRLLQNRRAAQLKDVLYKTGYLNPNVLWDTVKEYIGGLGDNESQQEVIRLQLECVARVQTCGYPHTVDFSELSDNKWFPNCLSWKGDITDFGGRLFKNITPLQYAFWALDMDTIRQLSEHMLVQTQCEQLLEFESTDYGHGRHISFDSVLVALQKYSKMVAEQCDQAKNVCDHPNPYGHFEIRIPSIAREIKKLGLCDDEEGMAYLSLENGVCYQNDNEYLNIDGSLHIKPITIQMRHDAIEQFHRSLLQIYQAFRTQLLRSSESDEAVYTNTCVISLHV